MKRIVLLLVSVLLAGCAVSKLDWNQRAHVRCMESGRAGACVADVVESWNHVRAQCLRRDPIVKHCNADFDREFWCNTKKRVEKITNAKGETATKETSTEYGPGCMSSYDLSRRKSDYRDACLAGLPPIHDEEGAGCSCGDSGCSHSLPFYSDSVVLKYFPNL